MYDTACKILREFVVLRLRVDCKNVKNHTKPLAIWKFHKIYATYLFLTIPKRRPN